MMNNKKSFIGLFSAVIVFIALVFFVPEVEGLTSPGMASLALLIAAIILWVLEALPLAISTLLVMICMPYLDIMPAFQVWKEFMSPVFFFVLATFALTGALVKTNIPIRIAGFLLKWAGKNGKKLVLGFIAGTAFLSSIMSNVPSCALFSSLAIAILKANGDPKPGESSLGKALMIGIPFGSVMGGFATPAGTSINILALNMFEQTTGQTITFLNWMLVGIPLTAVGILVCAWGIVLVHKPEKITDEAIESAQKMLDDAGPLSVLEKKVITIIVLMFAFWILGTWVPAFDTTIVAMAGMIAFFLPGVNVLTWNEFVDSCSWEAIFMIGGVQSIAAGILGTGAAAWLVNSTLAGAVHWPVALTLLVASALAAILHVIVPTGPAVVGLALIPFIGVANLTGINPITITFIVVWWSGVTYLLPIDTVPLITYGYKYYRIPDMFKAGILPTIIMTGIAAAMIPFLVGLIF